MWNEPIVAESRPSVRRIARRAGVLAGMLMLAIAAGATAATTQIGRTEGSHYCVGSFNLVQATTAASSPSYAVPAGGGVITSWSTQGGQHASTVQLQVWRPTLTPGSYTLVGTSPIVAVTPNTLNTFSLASPIHVQAGDLLGVRNVSGTMLCILRTANGGDTVRFNVGPAAATGSTQVLGDVFSGWTLNIAATVAPASPTSKDRCKDGGWEQLTDDQGRQFENQGDCVSFVATQGRNSASG